MKLFHTVFFCLAMSCIAFPQSPDTKLDIPAGVKYKFASDEVNAAVKAVLEKALAGDQAVLKHLLSQSAVCGPMLWQTLKPVAGPVLLNTKPMTMIVATPAGVVTEGRGLASDEARQAFWVALTGKYPQLASAKVRKAKANEITYYWATIPFDIEEPFFAIEAGRDVFIAQIAHDKTKTALFWIDLVGDLKALKPQQPSDAKTKSIADALAADLESESPEAMYQAGKAYLAGNGVPADLEKGRTLMDGAAQKGLLDAQLLLGMAYFSGKYLPQDRVKAAPYLQMAASQGNAMAQYYVGAMFLYGTGLEKSAEKAMPYLQRAADQNFADAEYKLGAIYFQGIGVTSDKARACGLYTKAADHGNLAATNDLGWCYQQGEGVEKDLSKAMALYTKAAEAGHLRSQGNLAMLYQASGEWEKAYVWLRIAEMGGGGAQARPVIEQAKKHMTQGQIDSSEVKVAEWQKAHTKKP
ncbi:MAG: hypothetical protein DMG65_09875 [Candidatus Angelobacter sp. Gp1-AA117]|nr:MAG: hypothetical protein DMG65_09875 [Candidatus Angelobacter sp. Gp1-AA117]